MKKLDKTDQKQLDSVINNIVRNDVLVCCSYMISELVKDEKYSDEIIEFSILYDYEEAAIWYIENEMELDHLLSWDDDENLTRVELEREDGYESFCSAYNIEPGLIEAYEHWIVSPWLYKKLAEKGEMTTDDFLGFCVWGRATTGQSIDMDWVIKSIAYDVCDFEKEG